MEVPFESTTTTTTVAPTVQAIVEQIENEEVAETVAAALDGDVSSEDITQLAEVDFKQLPEEAVEAIVETLNDSPIEVKEQFEEEINVFSGEIDTYIPSGSNVSVGERRTIVAVTATVASPVSPLPTARRRKV